MKILECISNKIWNKPESSTDRKRPKGYMSGHAHKKIEIIFREKGMVSNEQKLHEHNKRFKLSHPVPRWLYLALLPQKIWLRMIIEQKNKKQAACDELHWAS